MILPIWNLFFEYTGKGIEHGGVGNPSKVIPFIFLSTPFFKTNIGLSMVDRDYWNDGQDVIVLTPDNIERKGKVCSLPFNYS